MAALKIQELHRTAFAALMGGAVALLVCALHLAGALQPLENIAYDLRFRRLARPELASRDVVIIALDNASFESPEMREYFGRWPWRRLLYAGLLYYLRQAPARAIGIDVTFAGRDSNQGDDDKFAAQLAQRPDSVLAFSLVDSPGREKVEEAELPTDRWSVSNAGCGSRALYGGIDLPLDSLSRKARGLGSTTVEPDSDGVLRQAPLLFRYRQHYYPAFALALAGPQLAWERRVEYRCGSLLRPPSLRLGGRSFPLTAKGNLAVYWYGPRGRDYEYSFRHYPVWRIANSVAEMDAGEKPEVPPSEFRDKIVLIGPSAIGIGDFHPTAFSSRLPGIEYQATLLSNLLKGHFVRPAGQVWALLGIIALALSTSLAVWRFADWRAYTALSLALAAAFVAFNFALFYWTRVSLVTVAPLVAVALSYTAGNLTRYLTEGREKKRYRATLVKYVAPQLVDAIMRNPRMAELHNEKLDLTVLFSDVRGFTSLSEKIPVDQLVATLNEFLNEMVEVIFRNGGTLDKFVGDCVMAIWGAPLRQENHAELAARTALEMQATLERLNERWRRQNRPELKIGVGINSGEMIFGNIGSERRMDFTVIGDNVNLAARLEGATKELKASIVISDATYQRIAPLAQVRELGTIYVKGKDVPIRVYELVGMAGKETEAYASAHATR